MERKPSISGSIGSNTSSFDDIPSRAYFKMECDDMGEVNDCCFNRAGNGFFTAGSDKVIRMYQMSGERATLTWVFWIMGNKSRFFWDSTIFELFILVYLENFIE